MASLTTKINNTDYSIKFKRGTLSFDTKDGKVYYGTYNSYFQHDQNLVVDSPPLEPNEIYLNNFYISQSEQQQETYYDGLTIKVEDYYDSNHYIIHPIPRTYYIEQNFNTSLSDSVTVLIRNSNLKFWSEISVQILDINNDFVEPYSISIVNGLCSVTVPPYEAINSSFMDNTACRLRLYFYNIDEFTNNIEFNEEYEENTTVTLRPMNYILWLKNNCIKFSDLINYEIYSSYVNGTATKLKQEIDTILEYIYGYLGEVGVVNLNLYFDNTNQALVMNVTVLDANIPQTIGLASYYNPVRDRIPSSYFDTDSYIGYYETEQISYDSQSITCTINYNNGNYNIVYTYDDDFYNSTKIGNGIAIVGNNWGIDNVCNLGVHLG